MSPGFFAREDIKSWLARAAPGEESARSALRKVLGSLVVEWRAKFQDSTATGLDDALRRLTAFLELRQDIDRNIHPDLVLERVLRILRRGG